MPSYKYFVDSIERTPINAGEIVINETLFNENGGYFLRKNLSTSIKFNAADYKYFKSQTDICRYFSFRIFKTFKAPIGDVKIYEGRFTLLNCQFSDDKCEVTIDIETNDQYTCLLQNWDKQFNVAQVTDTTQIWQVDSGTLLQFGIGIGTSAAPPTFVYSNGGSSDPLQYGAVVEEFQTDWVQNVGLTPPLFVTVDFMIYCREVIYTACVAGVPQEPAGGGWTLESSSCSANGGFSTWWRRFDYTSSWSFDIGGLGPANPYPYAAAQPAGDPPIPNFGYIGLSITPPTDGFDVYFTPPILEEKSLELRSRYVKGGRDLIEVLDRMAQDVCGAGYTVQSDFLTEAINPVTGIDNIAANLQLWTKSDIANAQLTEADAQSNFQASDIKMTLREFLSDLNTHFNIEWWIDENAPSIIRLEHVNQSRPQIVDLDLTTLDGGKWLERQNEYRYTSENVPIEEQWRFITASLPDFVGLPINYNGCGNEVRTYNTNQIDTELAVLLGDENQRETDGFIMVQTEAITEDGSLAQNGIIWNFFSPNMPLSISSLHDKFWPYERKLPSGTINGVSRTFFTFESLSEQRTFGFRICNPNEFDRRKLVRSTYGDCDIFELSYNLVTEMMTITLRFNF